MPSAALLYRVVLRHSSVVIPRVSYQAYVAKKVDALLGKYFAAGLIQHLTSSYSNRLVVIPKRSGGVAITINYKKLNNI